MKKLSDIQISATPNAQQSTVMIDGVLMRGMQKLTLVVSCNEPTKLILEGLVVDSTDSNGLDVIKIDGNLQAQTFRRVFFGGSIRILGAAPDEQHQ